MDATKKRVATVGAGPSGLAACKHALAKGFRPVVFEAGAAACGVWRRTLACTRLQTPWTMYRFSDFPWPAGELFPRNDKVLAYLTAYARCFGVLESIRFSSKVVGAEYVGASERELAAWERWSGNGEAFGDGSGEWHLTVHHADSDTTQIWLMGKLAETFYKMYIPTPKKGLVPDFSLMQSVGAWHLVVLPEKFNDGVEQGSIVVKKHDSSFSFSEDGLVLDGSGERVDADVVILATGFNDDQMLKDVFVSSWFSHMVTGPSDAAMLPLYRHCVHPRIPQMAVTGYLDIASSIYPCEMMAKWVAHLLAGTVRLPSVAAMERSVAEWERWGKQSIQRNGSVGMKSCIARITTWYNDLLCRDMGYSPKRKKSGVLAEWLQSYGPEDYAGIQ